METVTWLAVVGNLLGVTPEELLLALIAGLAGAAGAALPAPLGGVLRKLSELLSSKRQ